MIKALMLIFEPVKTWEKIALKKAGVAWVLFGYLTPLLLIAVAGETAGLIYLGKEQDLTPKVPVSRAIHFGIAEFVLAYLLIFICAKLVQSIAQTFHRRNSFLECFTCIAYALGPFFLLRLLNIVPEVNLWVSFGIGIALAISTLYSGLPRMLQPDPPHAFGLYLTSLMLIGGTAGLAQFLSWLIVSGKIKSL